MGADADSHQSRQHVTRPPLTKGIGSGRSAEAGGSLDDKNHGLECLAEVASNCADMIHMTSLLTCNDFH